VAPVKGESFGVDVSDRSCFPRGESGAATVAPRDGPRWICALDLCYAKVRTTDFTFQGND
jgi:hypothetical protein